MAGFLLDPIGMDRCVDRKKDKLLNDMKAKDCFEKYSLEDKVWLESK